MEILGFDHIALSCHSVEAMVAFYGEVLGMKTGEERPGKWAIWFGPHKISLQDDANKPELAVGTLPGTGNFCLLAGADIAEVAELLHGHGVELLDRGERLGATGPIQSIYFRDPEGNLVEIASRIEAR